MRAFFCDFTVFQNVNLICVLHGGEAVCDHDDRSAIREPFKRTLHRRFVFGVGKRRRFVQDEHGRIFEHDARNGNTLLLSARKVHALAADDGVHAMRELVQNIVALCVMESGEHLFPRCRRSAHAHVFKDGSFEQFAVLKDISDGIVQRLPVNILDVDAAHFDRARRRIPKTGYKSRSRRLSSAGGPYKRHRFTRFYIKSDAVDGVPVRTFICKRHVLKRNGIILRGLRRGRFGQRLDRQDTVDTLQGVGNDHIVFAHKHDLHQRDRDDGRKNDIKDEVQKEGSVHTARSKAKPRDDERHEHAVNSGRECDHRPHQAFGVGDYPCMVTVYGAFETLEREYRLPECLDDGYAAHIFHRLVVHVFERALILFHLARHVLSRHFGHDDKAEDGRNKAQKSEPPVEHEE